MTVRLCARAAALWASAATFKPAARSGLAGLAVAISLSGAGTAAAAAFVYNEGTPYGGQNESYVSRDLWNCESSCDFQSAATATADLAAGKVSITDYWDTGAGLAAGARIGDELTFSVAGAGAATVTQILFQFSFSATPEYGTSISFEAGLTPISGLGSVAKVSRTAAWTGVSTSYSGWASAPDSWAHPGVGVFSYAFQGPSATVDFDMLLTLDSWISVPDSYATVKMIAPSNVTVSSKSGLFPYDVSIVPSPGPEPSAWALMILGFGAAGSALRRRAALT